MCVDNSRDHVECRRLTVSILYTNILLINNYYSNNEQELFDCIFQYLSTHAHCMNNYNYYFRLF